MRKDILLPGLAVGGGAVGFGLRLWQRASAFDPETLLFAPGAPATYLLMGLVTVLALVFLLQARTIQGPKFLLPEFRCPSSAYMALMAASGLLMLGAGVLGLLEGLAELQLWRIAPETHLVTYPAALILCALLCFAAGPATLLLGKGVYRGTLEPVSALLVVFPPMAALVWVFAAHLSHGSDPVLMDYGFSLAAAAFLLLAHYDAAGFFHGRPHPRRTAFCALMGVVFGLISLADFPSPFPAALTAAFLLSALAGVWFLLRTAFGPPWPRHLLETQDTSEQTEPESGSDDE